MKVNSILLIIIFSLTTNIFSQVQFTPHMITFVPGSRSVFAIDLDSDGDMDALSASSGSEGGGEIAWYENDGNENFSAHTISVANGGESVYAVDVDSDGDMDVLSATHFDSKIAWYENDGNESFIPHTITTSAAGARTVFAIDIDGDGDMDVLSASSWDDKIAWYENDGNENFTPHTITTSADEAWSVYAVDVDGDGDIDVLSASNYDDKIAWYENDGNENFTPHTITTSADWANSVYAVDVDSDGDMDVLSASFLDGKIAWYENDGNENFTPHTIKEDYTLVTFWVYAADMDGDGDIDIISSEIAWYENDGNENFTTHTLTANPHHARSVYAVDIDGDADIDIISDKIAWYENLSSPISIEFDIKPQSCPNPIDVNSKGVLPVAILGMDDFDVTTIDPNSVQLQGVAPIRWSIEDVSTPAPDVCTTEGADGFDDLTLKFDMQEIVTALGEVVDGDEMVLSLTGELIDGKLIEGADKIIIKSKVKKGASILDDVVEINGTEVKIYPNPFDDLIYIDLISNLSRQIIIDMVDMNGRIVEHVFTGIITANVEHQFELNTKADLIPGSYILRIRTEKGELLTREIIIKQ